MWYRMFTGKKHDCETKKLYRRLNRKNIFYYISAALAIWRCDIQAVIIFISDKVPGGVIIYLSKV